jgi:hypothetical protein
VAASEETRRVVKCPSCGAPAEKGAVICSNCDYVLDPTFFTSERAEPSSAPRADTPPQTRATAPVPSARPAPLSAPATAGSTSLEGKGASPSAQLEQLWHDFQHLRKELRRPDQLTFYGALCEVLWCLLPWQDTARDGPVIGVVTLGVGVLLGVAATVGALVFRYRQLKPRWDPLWPWFIQIAGVCFMICWCLVSIRASWDARTVPGIESLEVPLSRPAFGAYAGLVSALVSLFGTLWGLKDKLS